MATYVIAYTGPRGGKPKYAEVKAESGKAAAEKFVERTEKTYVVEVYAPVGLRDDKSQRRGHAAIEPYEPVVYDEEKAACGLPPWRGSGEPACYLDSEVSPLD